MILTCHFRNVNKGASVMNIIFNKEIPLYGRYDVAVIGAVLLVYVLLFPPPVKVRR